MWVKDRNHKQRRFRRRENDSLGSETEIRSHAPPERWRATSAGGSLPGITLKREGR